MKKKISPRKDLFLCTLGLFCKNLAGHWIVLQQTDQLSKPLSACKFAYQLSRTTFEIKIISHLRQVRNMNMRDFTQNFCRVNALCATLSLGLFSHLQKDCCMHGSLTWSPAPFGCGWPCLCESIWASSGIECIRFSNWVQDPLIIDEPLHWWNL